MNITKFLEFQETLLNKKLKKPIWNCQNPYIQISTKVQMLQEFQKVKEAFDNLSEPSGFHSYDKDDSLKVIMMLKFYKFYRSLFFLAFVGLWHSSSW